MFSAKKNLARPTARRWGMMQLSRKPIDTMNSSVPVSASERKSVASRAIRCRPPKLAMISSLVMLAKMSGRSATACLWKRGSLMGVVSVESKSKNTPRFMPKGCHRMLWRGLLIRRTEGNEQAA